MYTINFGHCNFSRSDVQGQPDDGPRGGEAGEGEHNLRGGRQPARGGVPVDVQQLRREHTAPVAARHQVRHDLDGELQAPDRDGLRDSALLGLEPNWPAAGALRLQHHTRR